MHFERSVADGGIHGGEQAAMVDGTQWMQAPIGFADHGIARHRAEFAQQSGGKFGHVAGHQQNPLRGAHGKRGQQPSQRTTIWNDVGDHGESQTTVGCGPDDGHIPDGFADHACHMRQQRSAEPRQQRFIAPHAGAAPAGQHESRSLHEKMVAMLRRNRIAALCFATALIALAPLQAQTATARKLVIRANRSGRLVTVSIPVTKPVRKTPSADITQMIAEAAKANDIDPLLVHSVIQVESNYNPYAVSSAGARGLMQLMPGTARDLGVTDSFDPRQNIEAGVKYLKQLKDQYKNEKLALAAYNAGPGSVQKYKAVPPYPETVNYVQRVGERYVEARKAAGIAPAVALQPVSPEVPQASVVLEVPTEEKHARLEQFLDEDGRLHLRTAPE